MVKAWVLAGLLLVGGAHYAIPPQVGTYLYQQHPTRITHMLLTCDGNPCVFVVAWYNRAGEVVGVGHFTVVDHGRWELGTLFYFEDRLGRCMVGCNLAGD